MADLGPMLTTFGSTRPNLVKLGPDVVSVGQVRPSLGHTKKRPSVGAMMAGFGRIRRADAWEVHTQISGQDVSRNVKYIIPSVCQDARPAELKFAFLFKVFPCRFSQVESAAPDAREDVLGGTHDRRGAPSSGEARWGVRRSLTEGNGYATAHPTSRRMFSPDPPLVCIDADRRALAASA